MRLRLGLRLRLGPGRGFGLEFCLTMGSGWLGLGLVFGINRGVRLEMGLRLNLKMTLDLRSRLRLGPREGGVVEIVAVAMLGTEARVWAEAGT